MALKTDLETAKELERSGIDLFHICLQKFRSLADHDFEYVGTSYDDAYIGLEAGNYDAALTNAFWTEERAEKYLIPEEQLGASVLVLAVRKENAYGGKHFPQVDILW